MKIGQIEIVIVVAYSALWWLFYFFVKMRADRKYLKSGEDEDFRPCQGCLVTQSAMMSACTLALLYAVVAADLVGFSR